MLNWNPTQPPVLLVFVISVFDLLWASGVVSARNPASLSLSFNCLAKGTPLSELLAKGLPFVSWDYSLLGNRNSFVIGGLLPSKRNSFAGATGRRNSFVSPGNCCWRKEFLCQYLQYRWRPSSQQRAWKRLVLSGLISSNVVVSPDRTVNFGSGSRRLVFRLIQRPAASCGELRTRKLLLGQRTEAGQRRKPTTVLLLS